MFAPFSRVRIQGLVRRPELNGTVAVVLGAPEADGRIPVTGYPKCLSVKPENITVVANAEGEWRVGARFARTPAERNWCIADYILHTEMGDIEDPSKLIDALQARFVRPGAATRPIDTAELQAILHNTHHHFVHFVQLRQACVYFVLETHGGLARLWQCHVKDDMDVGVLPGELPALISVPIGYSAREWAEPRERLDWQLLLRSVHSRWGGGRDIHYKDLRILLEWVNQLQALTRALAERLVDQLPAALLREDEAWWLRRLNRECEAVAESRGAPVRLRMNPSPISALHYQNRPPQLEQ
jgi:hypothetical protein